MGIKRKLKIGTLIGIGLVGAILATKLKYKQVNEEFKKQMSALHEKALIYEKKLTSSGFPKEEDIIEAILAKFGYAKKKEKTEKIKILETILYQSNSQDSIVLYDLSDQQIKIKNYLYETADSKEKNAGMEMSIDLHDIKEFYLKKPNWPWSKKKRNVYGILALPSKVVVLEKGYIENIESYVLKGKRYYPEEKFYDKSVVEVPLKNIQKIRTEEKYVWEKT